ncbi:MAG TPA: polymer-forming cytoskeletal protein [Stellaceae bacterium]|nr:polymer-forming cytoskeletal protein [Stellaceae bacterium]
MWSKPADNNSKAARPRVSSNAVPSILSVDLKIDGDIVSEGEVHISGAVTGDVTARKLTLAEGGSINGTVKAEEVTISGHLAGRLAAGRATFTRTAHVAADVTHVSLTIESGASFEGFSRRVDAVEDLAASDKVARLAPPLTMTQAKVPEPAE